MEREREGAGEVYPWDAWVRELLGARMSREVLRLAAGQGFARSDAEDVLQETLWTAYRCLLAGRYDPSRGPLRAWVTGVARNMMHRARRHELRLAWMKRCCDDVPLDAFPSSRDLPSERVRREWVRTSIGRGLRRLRREMDRRNFAVYLAVTLGEERPAEVAARFGMRRTTVYNIKSRANRRMRELIAA